MMDDTWMLLAHFFLLEKKKVPSAYSLEENLGKVRWLLENLDGPNKEE